MSSTPARRELGFVLALAGAGLAAVLIVAFAPWYPADPPAVSEINVVRVDIVHLVDGRDGSVAVAP
jgi:hypothetical protein